MNSPCKEKKSNKEAVRPFYNNFPLLALWVGQGLSSVGSGIYTVALAWTVIKATGSTLTMGTVLILTQLPVIIFSFFGGAIGDRLPKRTILIFIDGFRTIIGIAWGMSLISRFPSILEIYIFSTLFGLSQAFFKPAYNAFLPELIHEDQIPRAVGINQFIMRFTHIIAPALGGVLVAAFSFGLVVIVDSLTYVVAFALNFLLPSIKYKKSGQSSILKDIHVGLVYFYRKKIIFWSVVLITFGNLCAITLDVNFPKFIQDSLNWNAQTYGFVMSGYGLGAAIAFLFLAIVSLKRFRGLIYLLTLFLGGSFFLFIPIVSSSFEMYLILAFIGICFGLTGAISITIVQQLTDPIYRSRIMGITSITGALIPIGFAIWGALGDLISDSLIFIISGCIIAYVAIMGFFTPLRKAA